MPIRPWDRRAALGVKRVEIRVHQAHVGLASEYLDLLLHLGWQPHVVVVDPADQLSAGDREGIVACAAWPLVCRLELCPHALSVAFGVATDDLRRAVGRMI